MARTMLARALCQSLGIFRPDGTEALLVIGGANYRRRDVAHGSRPAGCPGDHADPAGRRGAMREGVNTPRRRSMRCSVPMAERSG
jgi:hypothetical protein